MKRLLAILLVLTSLNATADPYSEALVGASLQQLAYEVSHNALHLSKFDSLLFSVFIVGSGLTMYNLMDIQPGPDQGSQMFNKCKWGWAGQVFSVGITIAIPGL